MTTMLWIDGQWQEGEAGQWRPVHDPATGEACGKVAKAEIADIDRAVDAAATAFRTWRLTSPYDRSAILRRAANIIRDRAQDIAAMITREQGKPTVEALSEVSVTADLIDWSAEEGRRTYGRIIPGRAHDVRQMVLKEPVGVVAAFSPWNFPINTAAHKVAAALAAGCTVILKAAEETPSAPAAMAEAFAEAGLPAGALNLLFGAPNEISERLIADPRVKKLSFTGSTAVGRQLASLAGQHLTKITMELGGHAPAIVFEDANWQRAAAILSSKKYRNAGQVCGSPTRILVHSRLFDRFTDHFVCHTAGMKVGNGMDKGTVMGPLANSRRIAAMEAMVADSVAKGAHLRHGGARIGNQGNFFEPTVISDVPTDAMAMNVEPFGPLALINRFDDFDEALAEANRLPYGLASYAYTSSARTAAEITDRIEAGMISINHHGLGLPEHPFGGVKDSGFGSEGGTEGVDAYLAVKFATQVGLDA
ncbi:NAD-dependent succinate-semialdehyde dehydrogenase [Mesorhizobium sp. NPDC059054]|uniref:NAD-dependent succinate-semialdehyde dehydrogenase n=1 Tax=Mesorhizobium sp. NPDC059054 TaxID=3346711 RepID=UPI0036CBA313